MPEVPVLLLQKLKILETSLEVDQCKDENGFIFPNEYIPLENRWFNGLLEELDSMLSAFLIDKKGRPDYDAHRAIAAFGYRVGPGETDSFGWLTGILYTKVGKIVYG